MFMLSGPDNLLVLLDFIASCTWVVFMEKVGSIVILCVILCIFLYSFFVSCFVMLVNCWLKAVAMSFAVVLGLLLKEIVRLACCDGFLLLRLDIRFQSLWVFVLWSQFSFSLSFQIFVL